MRHWNAQVDRSISQWAWEMNVARDIRAKRQRVPTNWVSRKREREGQGKINFKHTKKFKSLHQFQCKFDSKCCFFYSSAFLLCDATTAAIGFTRNERTEYFSLFAPFDRVKNKKDDGNEREHEYQRQRQQHNTQKTKLAKRYNPHHSLYVSLVCVCVYCAHRIM